MPSCPTKVQVRPGVEGDLAALTDVCNHYVRETAITFDTRTFTPGERRAWLLSHPEDGRHRLLVAQETAPADAATPGACPQDGARILGYATSSPFRPKDVYATSAEVSVQLTPCATGHGIGTLLYEALPAALEHEDLHRACAGMAAKSRPTPGTFAESRPAQGSRNHTGDGGQDAPADNAPSLRLPERFGFRHVGTYREVGRRFGAYRDVDWHEKELNGAGPAS